MGRETDSVINHVKEFIAKIETFTIEQAIVFGSRIKGDFLKSSDVDLILVSKDFEGIDFTDRISHILEFYDFWKGEGELEILCYTPEEFARKKKQIGLVYDAVKQGISLLLEPSNRKRR